MTFLQNKSEIVPQRLHFPRLLFPSRGHLYFFTKANQYSALSHKVVKSTKGKAGKMKTI